MSDDKSKVLPQSLIFEPLLSRKDLFRRYDEFIIKLLESFTPLSYFQSSFVFPFFFSFFFLSFYPSSSSYCHRCLVKSRFPARVGRNYSRTYRIFRARFNYDDDIITIVKENREGGGHLLFTRKFIHKFAQGKKIPRETRSKQQLLRRGIKYRRSRGFHRQRDKSALSPLSVCLSPRVDINYSRMNLRAFPINRICTINWQPRDRIKYNRHEELFPPASDKGTKVLLSLPRRLFMKNIYAIEQQSLVHGTTYSCIPVCMVDGEKGLFCFARCNMYIYIYI